MSNSVKARTLSPSSVPNWGATAVKAGVSLGDAQARSAGALGKNVKSHDQVSRKGARLEALSLKNKAAKLLLSDADANSVKLGKRLSHCGYVARSEVVGLLRRPGTEGGAARAGFSGLKSCNSVWCCPICSARISAKRREEMNALLSGARSAGLAVAMVTLTARHGRKTALVPFLDGLKKAWDRMRQRREWRVLPVVGTVTALEVTHGANGWHGHMHVLVVLDAPEPKALEALEAGRSGWLVSLASQGLDGNRAAWQVQAATAAGSYVAKWGAAEELAVGRAKQGREGGRTPWQLLVDARDGDVQASALWSEFARAFRGRRQLVWSRGLKARFGIDEVKDEDAPEVEQPAEVLRCWLGWSDEWRQARRRRAALLDAAEGGGDLDAAEFGPTDAKRWRDEVQAGQVIE